MDDGIDAKWLSALEAANPKFGFYSTKDALGKPSVALVFKLRLRLPPDYDVRVLVDPDTTRGRVREISEALGFKLKTVPDA